jgi:hypothetical protein
MMQDQSIKTARHVLEELKKLRNVERTPGWDQKVRCGVISFVYGGSLEHFLDSHILIYESRVARGECRTVIERAT